MADISNYDDLLDTDFKKFFPTGTFDTVYNTEAKYRADLKRNSSFAQGADGVVKFPLRYDGSFGFAMPDDNASFGLTRNPNNVQGQLTLEAFVTTVQVGLKSFWAAKGSKGSFNPSGLVADRVEQAVTENAVMTNIIYVGSNRGRIATVESDGSSNFVAAAPLGTVLLEENMLLAAYTAHTSGSIRDSFAYHYASTIDHSTRTVTYKKYDATTDDRLLVAGDGIYPSFSGTSGEDIYTRSPVSMPDIVDDGTDATTLFGRTKSSEPKLKAVVLTNGGVLRNVSEQLIMEAIQTPQRFTGKRITKAIANEGQGRKCLEFIQAERRYPGATTNDPRYKMGIGQDAIQLLAPGVSVPLEYERRAAPRSIYFLAFDQFFLDERLAPDWVGKDQWQLIPGSGTHKAGFIGYYGSVENQGCLMPRANSRLGDLKDPMLND
jgi:hypothetical protein